MKLEQHSVTISKQEISRRILNGLRSDFNVEKKMLSMIADIESNELGGPSADRGPKDEDGSTGGTHALAAGVKPRGNGQGRGSGA